jgi:5-methylcytosine-specific restriction protein A
LDIGGVMTKKVSTLWTDVELEVAVDAYLNMREMENNSLPFNKADIGLKLRNGALTARTKSAVELRMRNISSVMNELGLRPITGYVPAANVGANVSGKIEKMLNNKGVFRLESLAAQASDALPHLKVEEKSEHYLESPPTGVRHPKQSIAPAITYVRDEKVREWVLKQANGTCEGCGHAAPFLGVDGKPFLEVHHVRPLAQMGSDRVENAAALCPNCHRRCHLAADGKAFTESLYIRVKRLKEEHFDVV